MTETLREKRSRAGRLGGLTCFLHYGSEGMSEKGKKGGRPRSLTLKERQQALQQEEKNNNKGGELSFCISEQTNNLKVLKRRCKTHLVEMRRAKIEEGRTVEAVLPEGGV